MALAVTILNPYFDDYHRTGTTYFECEQSRREKSWQSAVVLSGIGLAVTTLYYTEYSDVVDERKRLNDKLYACALKEHEHWRDYTYAHTLEAFNWVYDLPEIVPAPLNPDAMPPVTESRFLNYENHDCVPTCASRQELAAYRRFAEINSAAALTANQYRRAEYRREFKTAGMSALDKSSKNTGAPARQSMGVGLSLTNTLVAMASSGMNSGLNMLGRGLGDFANSNWGDST